MRLHLLRHAEAHPTWPDETRELTENGRESLRGLARLVRDTGGLEVEEIRHSTLVRARQSAEVLAHELKLPAKLREIPGLAPEDPVVPVARTLASEKAKSLLLVGHNTHLERLTSLLLTGREHQPVAEIKKATLLCFERVDRPSALGQAEPIWILRWMLSPRFFR